MNLEPGGVAGNYQILDILRSSKDEVCYRVRNTLLQRVESMRVLGAAVASDPERTERFLREMRVHARLVHPNILTFFGAFELERQLVITAELVEGVTLAERLLSGPLPWDEAAGIVLQLLAALGHAHSVGVVHRDVTTARLIVTPGGAVKLTDFGLAKANTSPMLTQVGSVVGNLKYISPEQIRGTALVDGRSDLYSAGIVLYEAVTGRVPFDQKSQFELMAAQVGQSPAPPSTINPGIPPSADAVILKALEKDPAARYQNAADFTAALADARALARARLSNAVPVFIPAAAPPPRAVVEAAAPASEPATMAAGHVIALAASVDPAAPARATEPVAAPVIVAAAAAGIVQPAAPASQPEPAGTVVAGIIPVIASEPAAAPAGVTPLTPESVAPAPRHPLAAAEAAPESVTASAIPSGPVPTAAEGGIILSAPPGGAWGLREAVIYGSVATAVVLVVVAGWLLTGSS